MASIDGKTTIIGVKVATTWGTAVQAAANNAIAAELSWSANPTELNARLIGSGQHMVSDIDRANLQPTVTLTGDVGYRNNFDVILAHFWGTSGAPTEVTGAQADYLHTITFNTVIPALNKPLTIAYRTSDSTAIEFASWSCRTLTIRTTSVPGYLEYTAEGLANDITIAPSVNTYANLGSATIPADTELASVAFEDDWWVDTQASGALASADQRNITSWELTLNRPQEIVNEIKGSTGNSAPISSDRIDATLVTNLKENVDHTWFTAASAGTVYKGRFQVEGTQIGTGTNKHFNAYLPGMELVDFPKYDVTSPGVNPVTLTWRLTKPSANPTGMTSTYPYFTITNGLSTSLLA